MSKAVAWEVVELNEGYGVIVFHSHGLAARRLGAEKLDVEFEDTESWRAKDYDKYAKAGYADPRRLVIDHAWYYECDKCRHYINLNSCDDEQCHSQEDIEKMTVTQIHPIPLMNCGCDG